MKIFLILLAISLTSCTTINEKIEYYEKMQLEKHIQNIKNMHEQPLADYAHNQKSLIEENQELLKKCKNLTVESNDKDFIFCISKVAMVRNENEYQLNNKFEQAVNLNSSKFNRTYKNIINNNKKYIEDLPYYKTVVKNTNYLEKYVQDLMKKRDDAKISRVSKYNKTKVCHIHNMDMCNYKDSAFEVIDANNKVIQNQVIAYLVYNYTSEKTYMVEKSNIELVSFQTRYGEDIHLPSGTYIFVRNVTYTTLQGFNKTVPLFKKVN